LLKKVLVKSTQSSGRLLVGLRNKGPDVVRQEHTS